MNEDELKHYGVLGMKWGIRKAKYDYDTTNRPKVSPENVVSGKKKVISEETKAKREKAAKKYEDKKEKLTSIKNDLATKGVESEAFKTIYGKKSSTMNDATFYMLFGKTKKQAVVSGIEQMDERIRYNEKAAKAKREGKLTDVQKAAVGAAVVATAVAAGYALSRYGPQIDAGKEIAGNKFMQRFNRSHDVSGLKAYKGVLDNNDIVVPKGTIFKRMSADPEYMTRKNVYAAFTEDDIQRYKGILPTYFKWIPKDSAYQVELEAKVDIVSPSLKKRIDTFTQMLNESSEYRDKFNIPQDASPKQLKDYGLKHYQKFAKNDAGRTKMGTEYFNKLSEMGYNAWVDDNDRGRLSDIPMVIFNNKNELSRIDAHEISPSEIEDAVKKIKELKNRIR